MLLMMSSSLVMKKLITFSHKAIKVMLTFMMTLIKPEVMGNRMRTTLIFD